MDPDFKPRRTAIHRRPRAQPDAAEPPRTPAVTLRSWLPMVRRHAIRTADKCRGAVSVADLCDAGVHGLVEALGSSSSAGTSREAHVETAVLAAMRDHLLTHVARPPATVSFTIARAMDALGAPEMAPAADPTRIASQFEEAVGDLREEDRALLSLVYVERRSLASIAASLGRSLTEVTLAHGAILDRLRTALASR